MPGLMTSNADLISRLTEAMQPDRALDHAIHARTNPPLRDGLVAGLVPKYTASVEAVISLIETKLPGWTWKVGTCCVSDDAWIAPDFNCPVHGARLKLELGYEAIARGSIWDSGADIDLRPSGRPAIALCIAFFTVLAAKEADAS